MWIIPLIFKPLSTATNTALNLKVEICKGLSTEDYSTAEKKLAGFWH
jgi:hypothetical protein